MDLEQFNRQWRTILAVLLLYLPIILSVIFVEPLHAQGQVSNDETCFAVADGYKRNFQGGNSGTDVLDHIARDTLVLLNRRTGETYSVNGEIPNMSTFNVEAMAFSPGGGLLYVADGERLGTVDLLTADYTARPERFGTGQGYRGGSTTLTDHEFRDVDSLAFDPTTGDLWGTSRTTNTDTGVISDNPPDILFRIDPSTGSFIPNAFTSPVNAGEFVDYLEITPITDLDLGATPLADIDDIAIDPVFGIMYAIMNEGGGPSKLVTINPENGSTSEVANFIRQDTGEQIADMEAISFFNDGQLYGSTGKNWLEGRNVLWQINKENAVVDYVGEFTPRLIDFEGLGCLTATTYLTLEKSTNGEDADQLPGPLLAEGEAITWRYLVRNTTSKTLTDIQVVDDNGTPDNSGDDVVVCKNFDLAPGQSNEDAGITCTLSGTAQLIRYTNVGVATATVTDDNGVPFTVRDEDTSNYVGFEPAAVGDFVWLDVDKNGRQDAFEPPVEGVIVNLFHEDGTLAGTTVTDENGFYIFAREDPGRYYLEFDLSQTNFVAFTTRGAADPERDSDVFSNPLSPDFGRTAIFTLVDGKYDNTRDAGLIGDGVRASIGDFVWLDRNGNGIQDTAADGSPEPGLAGATVELFDTDGTQIGATITTGSDGSYFFDDLPAGDYFLVFNGPTDFLPTAVNMGDDDQLDSDSMGATGQTGLINLSPGERDNSVDAGYFQPGTLTGIVWDDLDGDGIQDDNEPGIPDVVVTLTGPDGSTQTTVTDANGQYIFENLPPGDYSVTFTLPDGRVFSPQDQGSDDTVDSDADPNDGTTTSISLESGGQGELDAGLIQLGEIMGVVWDDLDGDGIQDSDEPGISGVVVTLIGQDGPLGTDTTNANGQYRFDDLPPGDYSVIFTLPDGRVFSPQDQGGDDTRDSDADPTDGSTTNVTVTSGGSEELDAGLVIQGSLGDRVFDDLDGNGIQDSTEPGVSGVLVTLLNSQGVQQATDTTDSDGFYSFPNLAAGDYTITFARPAGAIFSPQDQGSDDSRDSDVNPDDGRITTTLTAGEEDETLDAGIIRTTGIGDLVFNDLDGDGIQDSNEPGMAGVQVTITGEGITESTTTDDNGRYSFANLTPGDYVVTFVLPDGAIFSPQDQGSNDARDSDADPDDGTVSVTLAAGEANETIDAGIITTLSLGDFVFDDLDGDGIQDANERGVAGVQVKLTGESSVEQNTTTDGTGRYSFENLVPGDYTVTFVLPDGMIFSPQDQGSNDTVDSDADPDDGAVFVSLVPGQSDDSIDAGIIRTVSLGDFVFNDLDGDGIQDDGEPGISGVQVTLRDDQGATKNDTTDSSGRYSFTDLVPGTYTITFVRPNDATFSPQDQGNNDSVDSDVDPDDGTVTVILNAGQSDSSIDAGLILEDLNAPASLGDRVWFDQDEDGIQDSNEPGLAGVTVQLLDEDGTVIDSMVTDPAGLYEFTALPPNDYIIQVIDPIGGTPTTPDQGNDDTADSDIQTTDDGSRSPLITLSPGEDDPTVDAGYFCAPIVGGTVWEDSNSDGVRGPNEAGLADVFVQIIAESTGQVVAEIYTGMDGSFLATDLDEDETYTIDANLPFASRQLIPTTDEPLRGVVPTFCRAPNRIGYGPTQLGIIGDLVWYDANGNGEPDEWLDANGNGVLDRGDPNEWYAPFPMATDATPEAGEFDACGIANVTLILRDDSGAELDRTESNAFGWYTFFNLDEADYTVQVDTTDPDLVAGALAIANSGLCLSGTPPVAIPLTRRSAYPYWARFQEQLPAQEGDLTCRLTTPERITNFLTVDQGPPTDGIDLTFDFGIICEGNSTLGDRVWFDDNGNGLQDEGEPGANAIEVILTDSQGATRTLFTNPSGQYLFTNLPSGNYTVTFVLPNGLIFTTPNATNDQSPTTSDQEDSDADPVDGTTPTITLVAGTDDLTIDAGLLRVASLGDFVWEDLDGDGLQDSNEPGVSGVQVTLRDSQNISQTTLTDNNGRYEFTDLIPGDYVVTFALPAGAFWTTPNATNDQSPATSDQVDSDVDPDDSSVSVTLAPGEQNDTIDGGILQRTGLGDFVWRDLDNDGLQDSDEPGVADVTVELLGEDGTVLATTQTDENGRYEFTELEPSVIYRVRFTPPDRLAFTILDRGSDDERDSDVDPATNTTAPLTLDSGEFDDSVDAGLADLARLGDRVWEDVDGNGLQDDGEPGISGVAVRLLDDGGSEVASATTDASGIYFFTGLPAGTYQVEFATPDGFSPTAANVSPTGIANPDTVDSDGDPATGRTEFVTLEPGDINITLDTGFYRPVTVGDEVWEDLNGNGINEPGEPAVNGVTVELFRQGEDAPVDQQTTQDGRYLFENLPPGSYFAIFQPPDDFSFTVSDRGNDDSVDSDANPVSGVTSMIILASGEEDRTLDVGLVRLASVGDFVFRDTSGDGIQDPTEDGMADVAISLFNQAGTLIDQTVSGSDGSYNFTNLQPGEYYIAFTQPDDYSFALPGQGNDPTLDSDVDRISGVTTSFTLLSGEVNNDIDAGLNPFSTLGDFVWSDVDGDGIQGPDESGLGQITLVLYNDDDNVAIQQTLSEDDGSYTFSELVPGTYSVVVERPIGFEFTQQDRGDDDAVDSDVDSNGASPSTAVGFGETNFTIDVGLRPLSAAIAVEKSTNGVDADEAGTLALAEDSTVTWRYVVRNIGNVDLTNIQLVDDQIGAINGTANCPGTVLGVGQMMVCTVSGVAALGPYVNVATVTAVPEGQPGVTVEDSDSSHYTGVSLNLKIDKSDGDVVEATPGEPLTYTLVYANDGPTTATDVQIVDDLPADVTFLEILEETPPIAQEPLVTLIPGANQRVIWRIPELAANASGTIVFTVNTDPDLAEKTITNKVVIRCDGIIDAATQLGRSLADNQNVNCDELDRELSDNEDKELTNFAKPTAISLQRFDVLSSPNGITIEWITTAELNTSGFLLYRSTTPDFKTAVVINEEAVEALSESGGLYTYEDTSALETLPYYYWLVELENGVAQTPYGPERGRPQSIKDDYSIFLPMITVDIQ